MKRVAALMLALAGTLVLLWPTGDDPPSPEAATGEILRPDGAPRVETPVLRGPDASPPRRPAPVEAPRPAARGTGATTTIHVEGLDGTKVEKALVRLLQDDAGRPARISGGLIRARRAAVPMEVPAFTEITWIEVLHPETSDGEALPLAPTWAGPFEGGAPTAHVRLTPALSIAGLVVDAAGRPCERARLVALFDKGENRPWEAHREGVSDADGAFRITGLRKGTYHLEAWPRGPNAPPPPLATEAGQDDVEVRLRPGVVVRLHVVDSGGAPVPGIPVKVRTSTSLGTGFGSTADIAAGTTDDAGQVLLDGLDPGRSYLFNVTPPRERKDLVPVWVSSWKPAGGTITLRRAVQVRGRVQYADGTPCPYASVSVYPGGGVGLLGLDGASRKDGTFVVDRVPEGPVHVRASRYAVNGMHWNSASVATQAPATDVVLVMVSDPVATFVVRFDRDVGYVQLTEDRGNALGPGRRPEIEGRVATFERLRMKRSYLLYACSADKAACAYLKDVEPTEKGLDVRFGTGHTIRGRVHAPADATNVRVYASGRGVSQGAEVSPSGDFVIEGLPEGTWTVGASASLDKRFLLEKVEATTGDTVDITLE